MNTLTQKNWIAFRTILSKEVNRFMRIWTQTLLPPVVTITLYFIIFGKLIGSQINPIEGYSYMQYIVPGLTMMAVMTNAYSNTAASFFGAKFSKSIEEMLVSSMPSSIILLGYMVAGTIRGLLVGMIVLFISFLFTHIPIRYPFVVISIALLSAMVFALAGLINGMLAKTFDDISYIPTFILTPLTYLGGVFYSIHQLHPFWQQISFFNPVFNIVNTFKYGTLGITDSSVVFGFLLILSLFFVLFLWSLHLLQKGIGLRQ